MSYDQTNFERIRAILGKINGLIWELNNTPMSESVVTWNDEIIRVGNDLVKVGKAYKRQEDRIKQIHKKDE